MAAGIGGVGLELADVVQERAGDRDVAIDAGEGRGHRADALGDREAVLEQAVHVGLVVELGRRRAPVELPRRRVRAEHALEQRAQVRVLRRWRRARAPRAPSSRPSAAGRRRGRRRRTSPARPRSARAARLRAEARVDLVAPAHVDRPAGRHSSRSSGTSSRTIAASRPVRSPSDSLRNGVPSRLVRGSAARTSRTWSRSCPSVRSRTSRARNRRAARGRH